MRESVDRCVTDQSPRDGTMDSMSEWPVISARRFEISVRSSMYFGVCIPAFTLLGALANPDVRASSTPALLITILAVTIAQTICNIAVSRWSFDTLAGRTDRAPIPLLIVWLLLLVGVVVGAVALSVPAMRVTAATAIGAAAASLVPMFDARRTLFLNIAMLVLAVPLVAFIPLPLLLVCVVMASAVLWVGWSTVWMLTVLRELQGAHEDRAALALAEERLRISRDLHDVFGRTLTTIAVKSDLAAELIRRGVDDRAAAELQEVRRLADAAGTEVRRVIRGEHETSWEGEVSGARALLGSAGITCTIVGDPVPAASAEALAWVVREGVTNILRHSAATRVTLTTTVDDTHVLLTIANDGIDAASPGAAREPADVGGTGLRAMFARITEIGGRAETRSEGDWFVLEATVPAEARRPTDPDRPAEARRPADAHNHADTHPKDPR